MRKFFTKTIRFFVLIMTAILLSAGYVTCSTEPVQVVSVHSDMPLTIPENGG